MATCAACEAEMDVDEFDVDRGDTLSCPECGANLEVVGLSPVELETADEDLEAGDVSDDDDQDDGLRKLDDDDEDVE